MSAVITELRYQIAERDRYYEPTPYRRGIPSLSIAGPPTIDIEMRIRTDDPDLVRLFQDVMDRGGDFAEVVIALAREALPRGPGVSVEKTYVDPIQRAREASLAGTYVDEEYARQVREMMLAPVTIDPKEVMAIAASLGVMPSPSLRGGDWPAAEPPKKPEPPPKPTRMGALDFGDDAEPEKKP